MTKFATFICAAGLAFVVGCAQTDTGVTTSVQTRLADDDVVQARDIDVTTEDGVVTLSGDVASQIEREQAIMIARQTDGVRDVVDQLRVADTAPTTGFAVPEGGRIEATPEAHGANPDADLDVDTGRE